MRFAGRISNWNDDKGFGFVTPTGDGDRVFVHIKSFQLRSRRPVDGDLVSYLPTTDAKGRLNASQVRFAGQQAPAPVTPRASLPRAWIGAAFLLLVLGGYALGRLPMLVPAGYIALSGLSLLRYWVDKSAATRDRSRVPEASLHLGDLLGGWPGGLIAQQVFRHKTVKSSFQIAFWMTVAANLALVFALLRGGHFGA